MYRNTKIQAYIYIHAHAHAQTQHTHTFSLSLSYTHTHINTHTHTHTYIYISRVMYIPDRGHCSVKMDVLMSYSAEVSNDLSFKSVYLHL